MPLTKVTYSMIDGPFINPKDYGVIGNGVDDDSIAMQAALTAAVTTQSPLVLSTTTYNISDDALSATLSAGEKLVIIGNGAVFNTTIADAAEYYDGYFTITGTDTSEVIIRDLTITSDQAGDLSPSRVRGKMIGLSINTMSNVVLENVKVTGFAFMNIRLYYLDQGLVLNCQAINSRYAGLVMQSCLDVNVYGGVYNENGGYDGVQEGYGITCASRHNSGDRDNARIKINGLSAINNIGKGIDAHDCVSLVITNNRVRGFMYNGIYAVNEGGSKNVSDVIICGNEIDGTFDYDSTTNTRMGIQTGGYGASSFCGSFIVTDNIIVNIDHPTFSCYGVLIENPNSGYAPDYVIVSNNSLQDTANTGGSCIRTNGGTLPIKTIIVSNNSIYQTRNCSNIILIGTSTNSTLNNNIITASGGVTVTHGIYPYSLANTIISSNIVGGGATFTVPITIFGYACQIARGNIVNGVPMADWINTGATVDFGTAIPTTGEGYFYQGSIRWNKNATSGQPAGWMCTVAGITSGSPASTWKAMANLA